MVCANIPCKYLWIRVVFPTPASPRMTTFMSLWNRTQHVIGMSKNDNTKHKRLTLANAKPLGKRIKYIISYLTPFSWLDSWLIGVGASAYPTKRWTSARITSIVVSKALSLLQWSNTVISWLWNVYFRQILIVENSKVIIQQKSRDLVEGTTMLHFCLQPDRSLERK